MGCGRSILTNGKLPKPIAFLPFSLPSPSSMLKLPNILPSPPLSSIRHAGYKKCLRELCFYSPYRQNVRMMVHRRVDIHTDKSLVPIYTYLS